MAKRSKEEIQAQIDALTTELEDDDTELLVEHPKTGAKATLRGANAKSFLASILGAEDGDGDAGDGDGDAGDGDGDAGDGGDPAPRASVWGRK